MSTAPRDESDFSTRPGGGVAPARVLGRHPHDQAADLRDHSGPSRPTFRVGPFPDDELPVPSTNRVRRDDRRDLSPNPTTETRAEGGQTSPVSVGQPQARMAPLRLQDGVSSRSPG
jgi:hypothetical protein